MGSRTYSHNPYGHTVLGEPMTPCGDVPVAAVLGKRRFSPYPVSEASSSHMTSTASTPHQSPHHCPAAPPPPPAPIADDAEDPSALDQIPVFEDVEFSSNDGSEVVCLFIGQLPFRISDNKVAWIVKNVGQASKIFGIEAIWKRNAQTGLMQHKGCVQISVPSSEAPGIIARLHHRLIVDYNNVLSGSVEAVARHSRNHPNSRPMVCQTSNRTAPLGR